MKKRRVLAILLILTEMAFLFLLHNWSVLIETVSFLRYSFMYFMLGTIFGRFSCNTNLIFDEAKKIILSNVTFFLATNVMNSLRMWTIQYMLWNLFTSALMSFIALAVNRSYRVWFRKWLAQNVLIIGTGSEAYDLEYVYQTNRFALSRIIGIVDCNNSYKLPGIIQTVEPFCEEIIPYDDLDEYLNTHAVDEAVISIPDASLEQTQILYEYLSSRISVIKTMPKVNGIVTHQSVVEDYDGLILISSSTGLMSQDVFGMIIKRLADIVCGFLGVVILIPLSIYIKARFLSSGDRENIFFAQERIGKNGKLFRLYKFRSMVPDAENVLEKMMAESAEIREEYETNKKLENDPRVTKIGEKMRRSSVDELPQLLNVLIGQMSLVGPRPYLPRERADMGKYYDVIIQCKPGITGMWQTHGRSEAPFPQRLRFDDYYVRNWSIWMDMTILFKTIRAVNESRGAK
ncbi:MAG: exopolysaccharide biosynthesis polyprenyl glycosylphosphotransferase [Solobacterium sp.]|nr:exopolysaccharide biosynthesis polyprenyl glycosylphosphotransferase [Solobacterium sp.]